MRDVQGKALNSSGLNWKLNQNGIKFGLVPVLKIGTASLVQFYLIFKKSILT
jgi:hypothetical protein